MNKAANFYLIYWNEVLVAMNSVLPVPNGDIKHMFRSHRLVVLPDFQGLGIGTKINDFFGEYYLSKGLRYCMRTTHHRLINHMKDDGCWKATSNNNKNNITRSSHNMMFQKLMTNQKYLERTCASYEYVGKDYATKPHKEVYIDNYSEDKIDKIEKYLTELKKDNYVLVYHGSLQDTKVDEICQNLGIVVIPMYKNKKGVFGIKGKYQQYQNRNVEVSVD